MSSCYHCLPAAWFLLALLALGCGGRKLDRNQALCTSAPDQVLPALWPKRGCMQRGAKQTAAQTPSEGKLHPLPEGRGLVTFSGSPGAKSLSTMCTLHPQL